VAGQELARLEPIRVLFDLEIIVKLR